MRFKEATLLVVCIVMGFSHMLKAQSSERAYSMDFAYTGDIFSNLAGGIDQGVRYLDNIDITLDIDAEQVIGLTNTRAFIYGLGNQGGNITELTGDVQVTNNIETENSWRIYEAWVQYISPESRTSYLAGLYDLNSEFDVNNTGSLFINSSHGIGAAFAASGNTGPSIFPLTSVAGRFKFSPVDDVMFKVAAFDGVPSDPGNTRGTKIYFREDEGLLLASELSFYSRKRQEFSSLSSGEQLLVNLDRTAGEQYKTKLAFGGWYYTSGQSTFSDPSVRENNWGIYALAETEIFSEWDDRSQGLSGFLRAGTANESVNRFAWYFGAGLVYTGIFKGADNDQLGLALALPLNSEEYLNSAGSPADMKHRGELNIEFTYQKIISDQFSIQFDSQYIVNPGMRSTLPNAWIMGVRFTAAIN